MDIKIDSQEGKFKFRVCGILKHNDKYLVVKMNDNINFCFPGGHVELGEDTEQAVKREMGEELGYEVEVERLISINQNFFKAQDGKFFHELGYYYIVTAKDPKDVNTEDYDRDELDKGKIQHLRFRWYTKEELKDVDFRPNYLIECLDNTTPTLNVTRY